MPKYLVSPKKSSTFAPDLRLRLVNLKNGKNLIKKCNAENQPLTKKVKIFAKKLLKNLVSPKKSSTFAADFALNGKRAQKSTVIFERLKQ